MRVLCLNLHIPQDPSVSEIFLRLSPRVQYRPPGYIFIEIESTSHLFNGESSLLKEAVHLARQLAPQTTAAIANTAYWAQVLATYRPFEITHPEKEEIILGDLPVEALTDLEGLETWNQKRKIENIISFFQSLELHRFHHLIPFELSSFRERWGDIGVAIWKRIHHRDLQVISPFIPQDPLYFYAYSDFPMIHVDPIVDHVQKGLTILFLRLQGLAKSCRRVQLTLHCEYSQHKHFFSIEPAQPSRDLKLFLDLICKKLDGVSLENPIKEIEIEVHDLPEKTEQLDFFEPRDLTKDRWLRLISFAKQAGCQMGFLQMEASHFPEQSFSFKNEWPEKLKVQDAVEKEDSAIQVKSAYGKATLKNPRPSVLLKSPILISKMEQIKILSRVPVERIESSWWEQFKRKHLKRDYYFAMSTEGQLLWIFQDLLNQNYYLHGYFD